MGYIGIVLEAGDKSGSDILMGKTDNKHVNKVASDRNKIKRCKRIESNGEGERSI